MQSHISIIFYSTKMFCTVCVQLTLRISGCAFLILFLMSHRLQDIQNHQDQVTDLDHCYDLTDSTFLILGISINPGSWILTLLYLMIPAIVVWVVNSEYIITKLLSSMDSTNPIWVHLSWKHQKLLLDHHPIIIFWVMSSRWNLFNWALSNRRW